MSDNAEMKPYLARLAELFEAEGDAETAQALMDQLESRPSSGLPEADAESLRSLIAQAERACKYGDYERAKPLYVRALAMREEALGPDHLDTLCSMNDLARCMLLNRESDQAETMYTRLLRVATTSLGPDDKLARITRDNIAACKEATQRVWGSLRLERQINRMFQESNVKVQVERAARLDRLYAIAARFKLQGRYGRALPFFEAWIGTRLAGAHPDDEEAIQDIAHYARFLARAGKTARSQSAFKAIVAIRNRQHRLGQGAQALRQALTEWARSMDKLGDHASARTTIELASRIS